MSDTARNALRSMLAEIMGDYGLDINRDRIPRKLALEINCRLSQRLFTEKLPD